MGKIRTFETGANRDTDEGKLDFEGFLSPLVIHRFGEYMSKNRHMRDGSLRDSDNWQRGIPLTVYIKSLFRHFVEVWSHHRGWKVLSQEAFEEAICAVLFNTQGYLHEILKARGYLKQP